MSSLLKRQQQQQAFLVWDWIRKPAEKPAGQGGGGCGDGKAWGGGGALGWQLQSYSKKRRRRGRRNSDKMEAQGFVVGRQQTRVKVVCFPVQQHSELAPGEAIHHCTCRWGQRGVSWEWGEGARAGPRGSGCSQF